MTKARIVQRSALCAILFLIFACSWLPRSSRGEDLIPLNFAYYQGTLLSFPPQVAAAEGIFKKHGLDVTLINFSSCPDQLTAIASGGVDTVSCPAPLVIKVNTKGFDLLAITDNIAAAQYSLLARKGEARPNRDKPYPENIRDLKGKIIGVTVRGSDVENVARVFLKDAGLDPDQDVTWLAVGSVPTSIAAFKARRLDYLVAWEPAQTVLVDIDKVAEYVVDQRKGEGNPLFKTFMSNATEAKRSQLEQSPEKYLRFAAAIEETMTFIKDPAHFDRLVQIYQSSSGLDKPTIEALLRNNIKYFSNRFQCQAVNNVAKFEVEIGDVAADKAPTCKDFVWSAMQKYIDYP
jgi:sulfonate transport system substrate-binding protein